MLHKFKYDKKEIGNHRSISFNVGMVWSEDGEICQETFGYYYGTERMCIEKRRCDKNERVKTDNGNVV